MVRRAVVLFVLVVSLSPGVAIAANPHRIFDASACATPSGDQLVLTAAWSGMRVAAWSYFVESTEGSGGIFDTVPQPGKAGTVTQTVGAEDVANIQTVSATVFRAAGPHYFELASETLTQPASGWAAC